MHLCGALASSPAGATTVASGYLDALLQRLREVKFPVRERVAAAVSLGQIARAGEHGFELAKGSGGLQDLLALAQSAGHFELRAACMLALSLNAQHPLARPFLLQAGWHTRTVHQSDLCRYSLCLPEVFSPAMRAVRGAHAAKPGLVTGQTPNSALLKDSDKPEFAMKDPATASLESVAAMSNPVPSAQSAARSSLRALRRKHPGLFKQESFFLSTVTMLEKYRYSASARRYVWDLFNEGLQDFDNGDGGVNEDGTSADPGS